MHTVGEVATGTDDQNRFVGVVNDALEILEKTNQQYVTFDRTTYESPPEGVARYERIRERTILLLHAAQELRLNRWHPPYIAACILRNLLSTVDTPSELAEPFIQAYGQEIADILGEAKPE